MASRLVRLKAQMLLPRRDEEDGWEDPRAELVRRLLEYQQIREIAVWLGRSAERRAEQFARGYLPRRAGDRRRRRSRSTWSSCSRPSSGSSPRSRRRCCTGSWPGPSTSKAATRRLEALLDERAEFGWLEALGPHPTIVDVLSTLLALLELAKRGALRLRATGRLRAHGDRP